MLTVLLAALLGGGAVLPPPAPPAVIRVPDEPGAIVLPDDEPTLQAVAADLEGDGAPEVVRLIGVDGGPLWIEVWREAADGWALAAPPGAAVPGSAGQAELAYARRPVRLLVRSADGRDRVTLVRQPDFSEPEDPAECCLLLDDVVLAGETLRLVRVADPGGIADAVHVIDLDGDGTDELLATYFLTPLNDASTSTEARVFRWSDGRFAPPKITELPVGSGSTAFILGDSDGVLGDEAAVISSAARNFLFRISLGPEDSLLVENAGFIADEALAVPLGVRRRGLAVLGPGFGLAVISWPRGEPARDPAAALPIENARLLGVVEVGGVPRLLAHRADIDALHVLALPDLEPLPLGPIRPSRAAASMAGGPLEPYVGPLPGGGQTGRAAAIVAGRLLPAPRLDGVAAPAGAFAGGQPLGLVGRDRAWLAIQLGALRLAAIDPAGGRLDPPVVDPAAVVTLAPLTAAATPEANGGVHEPTVRGGIPLDDGVTGVSGDGLVAEVRAPTGSRVYLPDPDRPGAVVPQVVGDDGALDVVVDPPADATAVAPGQVTMTVVTPAGHVYVSAWSMRLMEGPPDLDASTETPLGSSRVTIAGRAARYAEVEVGGTVVAIDEDGYFSTSVELPPWPTAVIVIARDPIGNEARTVVSGVGIFDYRALPWVPIALMLMVGLAAALILRVPKPRTAPRPIGDDAALEELDPADRL